MASFLRPLLAVGLTLGFSAAWVALGAAEVVAWWWARAVGGLAVVMAVVAALAVIALAAFSAVVLRRPSPRWPWPDGLGGLMLGVSLMAGTVALCGILVGISVTLPSGGGTRGEGTFGPVPLAVTWAGWVSVGAAFLPVVALAESFIVGERVALAEGDLRAVVRRVVLLVAAAHLLWLALELVGWALRA